MQSINEICGVIGQMFDMMEEHFGSEVELVLHDLTLDYEHTIVDIRNGQITNREIGDCGDNLGLEVMRGTIVDGNRYNYVNYTESGQILRSSSLFLKDDDGKIIGSVCLNEDITKSVEFENYLRDKNKHSVKHKDLFTKDVNVLLDSLIQEAYLQIGLQQSAMLKEDKLSFIRFLDERGAFLITKSGTRVCRELNISKYTFYNYLDIVREGEKHKGEFPASGER